MANITLRFYDEEKKITVPKWGEIRLRPYQILAYISITRRNADTCSNAPIFPAIVDTGCGHCLAIHKDQFEAAKPWGMEFTPMQGEGSIRGFNGVISVSKPFRGDAWLHDFSPATVPANHRVPEVNNVKSVKLFFAQEGITCYGYEQSVIDSDEAAIGFFQRISAIFKKPSSRTPLTVVAGRLRDETSNRLALPHLPLLGLRSLCVNYFDIEMVCNPRGGQVRLKQKENVVISDHI